MNNKLLFPLALMNFFCSGENITKSPLVDVSNTQEEPSERDVLLWLLCDIFQGLHTRAVSTSNHLPSLQDGSSIAGCDRDVVV